MKLVTKSVITSKMKGRGKKGDYRYISSAVPNTLLKFMGWDKGHIHYHPNKYADFILMRRIQSISGLRSMQGDMKSAHTRELREYIKKKFPNKKELKVRDFKILNSIIKTGKGKRKHRELWQAYQNWLWFSYYLSLYRWLFPEEERLG